MLRRCPWWWWWVGGEANAAAAIHAARRSRGWKNLIDAFAQQRAEKEGRSLLLLCAAEIRRHRRGDGGLDGGLEVHQDNTLPHRSRPFPALVGRTHTISNRRPATAAHKKPGVAGVTGPRAAEAVRSRRRPPRRGPHPRPAPETRPSRRPPAPLRPAPPRPTQGRPPLAGSEGHLPRGSPGGGLGGLRGTRGRGQPPQERGLPCVVPPVGKKRPTPPDLPPGRGARAGPGSSPGGVPPPNPKPLGPGGRPAASSSSTSTSCWCHYHHHYHSARPPASSSFAGGRTGARAALARGHHPRRPAGRAALPARTSTPPPGDPPARAGGLAPRDRSRRPPSPPPHYLLRERGPTGRRRGQGVAAGEGAAGG